MSLKGEELVHGRPSARCAAPAGLPDRVVDNRSPANRAFASSSTAVFPSPTPLARDPVDVSAPQSDQIGDHPWAAPVCAPHRVRSHRLTALLAGAHVRTLSSRSRIVTMSRFHAVISNRPPVGPSAPSARRNQDVIRLDRLDEATVSRSAEKSRSPPTADRARQEGRLPVCVVDGNSSTRYSRGRTRSKVQRRGVMPLHLARSGGRCRQGVDASASAPLIDLGSRRTLGTAWRGHRLRARVAARPGTNAARTGAVAAPLDLARRSTSPRLPTTASLNRKA